jgi:hypothetical protein
MDLQKLRPTHSQWRAPLASATEGRARATAVPTASAAKQLSHLPKGKGGPLWQQFYNDAVAKAHPYPEKLADTLLRSREHAQEIEAKKHKLLITDKKPTIEEAAVVNKTGRKPKPVLHDALRCTAMTLEGRRCTFKSTCGAFCKKHSVEKM